MNKLDRNIKQSLSYVVKHRGEFRWGKVLGFTSQELLEHIKKEFSEGMSFDNYGKWVISYHIPRKCYKFKSIRDEDFRNFFSLKNITPKWLKDAQHQKKKISTKELDKFGLWDILPSGNISKYLIT